MLRLFLFLHISLCPLLTIPIEAKAEHLNFEGKKKVRPFFIEKDHPIKSKLDDIFSKARVIQNVQSMEKAGFIKPFPRHATHVVFTKHPDLPGYVIKAYLDDDLRYHRGITEYEHWCKRIKGAKAIQELINKHHLGDIFKTPKKWIYTLPKKPKPKKPCLKKDYILVEEDMDIYNDQGNKKHWRSAKVTKRTLDSLDLIITALGLRDCAKIDNLPFGKDGRIAFIDTESYNVWPIPYHVLDGSLSPENKAYWKKITNRQ